MTIVLCPACGGQKTVSKPPHIAGDVETWFSSGTVMYPCPTCDGRGWIDTDTNEDVNAVKCIALSSMETSENLMDECVHRGERIKELESVIDGNNLRIADLEWMRELVRNARKKREDELLGKIKELEERVNEKNTKIINIVDTCQDRVKKLDALVGAKDLRIFDLESMRDIVRKTRDIREDDLFDRINELGAELKRNQLKMELLYDILDIVNNMVNSPYINNGPFAADRMYDVCDTVFQFNKEQNTNG